jgi:hypothetical protein
MDDVVKKPYTTREAINKATGNPATAYYNKAGDYVVVDNVTGELVQVSKFVSCPCNFLCSICFACGKQALSDYRISAEE